jgi:hypothetical protein
MVPHATCLLDHFTDRWLTEAVVHLSSSPQAREVAGSWLAAYRAARGVGRAEVQARRQADAAYRQAAARSGLLTITEEVEASAA